ncbi:hypothetical protein CRENBAI_025025, partial [Crenichthys baileyi]
LDVRNAHQTLEISKRTTRKTHHNAPRQMRETRHRTSRHPEMHVHHGLFMKTRRP